MSVVAQGSSETITLAVGEQLTVVADALSSGNVWPFSNAPGDTPGVTAVAASATVTIGPFNTVKRYKVEAESGFLTYSAAVVDFNAPAEDTAAIAAAQAAAIAASLPRAALKSSLLAGSAAGDHTLAAIAVGDALVSVLYVVGAGTTVTNVLDLTAEFTVAAGKITNAAGTNTTGGKLFVLYNDLTP